MKDKEGRTERTMITLTPDEKEKSRELAKELGFGSESAMYRYFLINHLNKEEK